MLDVSYITGPIKRRPGSYLTDVNSMLHQVDARLKIVGLVVLIFATACITSPFQLIFFCVLTSTIITEQGLGMRNVWPSIKPIVPFALLIAIFNLFVVQDGSALLHLGPLSITNAGIWAAVLYAMRLLLAVTFGALLLLTTTPTAITDAIDSLFSPLAHFGLPVHEIAMVLSLAIRFIPILSREMQNIIDAQTCRGGSIEDGTLSERIHALGAILVAVFAGAMRHAQNLSLALDARCYEGGSGRTHYHQHHICKADFIFICFCAFSLTPLFISVV